MKNFFLVFTFFLFQFHLFGQIPGYLPVQDLIAWYPFNGNALDNSGHSHNGTVYAAVPAPDRFGNQNSSFDFYGTNGTIVIPDDPELRLSNCDYTVSVWVNLMNHSFDQDAILTKRIPSAYSGYIMNVQGQSQSNSGVINWQISGGNDPRYFSNNSLSLNKWHNLVAVYNFNSNALKFYIDGQLDGQITNFPTPYDTNASLYIGNDSNGQSYCFSGLIDDIAFYRRALSECEISQIFSSEIVGLTEQPISQTLISGESASFAVHSNQQCLSYQWQINTGIGFENLVNNNIYSGTNSPTLSIAPVSQSMNGDEFRCIVSSCNLCTIVSEVATLSILSGTDNSYFGDKLKIEPNPFCDFINFECQGGMVDYDLSIFDMNSKLIFNGKLNKKIQVTTSSFFNGVYIYKISNKGQILDIGKIVKQ